MTPLTAFGNTLSLAALAWVLLVAAVSFWRAWEIPSRLPEINELATKHLFLVPISFLLFITLSWLRLRQDQELEPSGSGSRFVRWRATLALWLLVFLHPVSCWVYPAVFNLDNRTLDEITRAVGTMRVGMPRTEVEKQILTLNATLPISMGADREQHRRAQQEVLEYLQTKDPALRSKLWPGLSRATLVFVPWGNKPGEEPDVEGREHVFQRRLRASSDIGTDRIRILYGPSFTLEKVIYSSNRQLTEVRGPCTIHLIVPAPPATSFPYPCTQESKG